VMLVEAPRRIANLMSDERIFTTKSKRKRCDTWHGEENKNEQQLDPDIEQGLNTKRKFARKNAWGYCSYADLITMALKRAPSKQMTLAEIYDWIVANIPFFKDKGDANSSVGWKNSIRHNLSLHDKFSRVTPTNVTKNIGAYWTLVPEDEQKDGTVQALPSSPPDSPAPPPTNNEPMPSPPPPGNIRKRSSTMPSSLSRHQRSKYKRNTTHTVGDGRSTSGDSGVLSREGSCASLAAHTNNVADEMARIKLENSPCSKNSGEQQRLNDENMQTINRYNREAKINPDNSVLVEIKLTGEQFELVKSGKYVVSLCAAESVGELGSDPVMQLTNWNAKQQQNAQTTQQKPRRQRQMQQQRAPPTYDSLNPNDYIQDGSDGQSTNPQSIRKRTQYNHPFSPLSSGSSGLGQSYDSPPSDYTLKQTHITVVQQSAPQIQQQQQQQRNHTPMLTNNNEVDEFKLEAASSSSTRTISADNGAMTSSGMELNADGIFDDLYSELNLYELDDIYDMPLN